MHLLLFIHKILFSSTCFELQVFIFRKIQLYTYSIWYCNSLWDFLVTCRYTAWLLTQAVYRQVTRNSHRVRQYHMLHVYNCIFLKMNTWGSKHVEENSILWINKNKCIKLVFNNDARSEKHQVILHCTLTKFLGSDIHTFFCLTFQCSNTLSSWHLFL